MVLLDPIGEPGGVETTTRRPVWRVRDEDGLVLWAYVEVRSTGPLITGYAKHEVRPHPEAGHAGAMLGAVLGLMVGYWMGGWFGALMGCVYGVMVGATTRLRR